MKLSGKVTNMLEPMQNVRAIVFLKTNVHMRAMISVKPFNIVRASIALKSIRDVRRVA